MAELLIIYLITFYSPLPITTIANKKHQIVKKWKELADNYHIFFTKFVQLDIRPLRLFLATFRFRWKCTEVVNEERRIKYGWPPFKNDLSCFENEKNICWTFFFFLNAALNYLSSDLKIRGAAHVFLNITTKGCPSLTQCRGEGAVRVPLSLLVINLTNTIHWRLNMSS